MMDLGTHTMRYLNRKFYILGDSEGSLIFHLGEFLGLPKGRIHVDGIPSELADFKIETGQLYLTSCAIASDFDKCPELDGIEPKDANYGYVKYCDMMMRIDFTGNLVFGNSVKNILNNTSLFRANCVNGDVKGVEDFSEEAKIAKQSIVQLKQQFYQEDAVYSKTPKQKRLLERKLLVIHNQLSEQVYGSDLHNLR